MHLQSVSKMHPTYFKKVRRGIKLMNVIHYVKKVHWYQSVQEIFKTEISDACICIYTVSYSFRNDEKPTVF